MKIANYKPAWAWFLTSIFFLFVLVMSVLFITKGAPKGYSYDIIHAILLLFWIFAIGGLLYVFSQPIVYITTNKDHIHMQIRYPFYSKKFIYDKKEIKNIMIDTQADSEGDPYYIIIIKTKKGHSFNVFESSYKEECEKKMEELKKFTQPSAQ